MGSTSAIHEVRHSQRRGLTLAEMMISVSVMGLLAIGIGTLASAVSMSNDYTTGHSTAVQHGRVALERITRAVDQSYATADFPACALFTDSVDGYSFPDTLVVWRPSGSPANAAGPPLIKELVVFCPDPDVPSQLLEITDTSDTRASQPLTNGGWWKSELDALKRRKTAQRIRLTNLLRVGYTSNSSTSARGQVRFSVMLRPSAAEWSAYKAGSIAWTSLSWAQSIYGTQTGLRQTWCQIELQLVPPTKGTSTGTQGPDPLPFFGSVAKYYELHR